MNNGDESDATPINSSGERRRVPQVIDGDPGDRGVVHVRNARVGLCAMAILGIVLFILIIMVTIEWSEIPRDFRQLPPFPPGPGVFQLHAENGESRWVLKENSHS